MMACVKRPDHLLIERKSGECINEVLHVNGLRKATAFLSENYVIKATRQRAHDRRSKSDTILVTAGAPNFLERRYIKLCKKVGMAFPLRKIRMEWYKEDKT